MSIKTLLVDDERSLLEQAEIFLERGDDEIKVSTASSAEGALELLDEERYDVIVSDYQMPDMDGIEFLKEVREERILDIPLIVFTGRGREKVAMEALNYGADRYIQKGGDAKSQFGVLAQAIKQEYKFYKKEKELKKSEKEKSIILEHTSDAIAYHDSKHNIIWANRTYLEATGMTLEEIKGEKCYDAWYGRDEPCEGCPVNKALKSGEVEKGEISPPEGDRVWLTTGAPMKDKDGNVERVIETSLDITDIKEKEKELEKREKVLSELHNVASRIEGVEEEEKVCNIAIEAGEEILEFSSCSIDLIDEEGNLAPVAFSTEIEADIVESRSPKEGGLGGRSFLNDESYVVEDIQENENIEPIREKYRSAISIPIKGHGVFQAFSKEIAQFDEKDLEFSELLIDHVVEALNRIESKRKEEFVHSMLRDELKNKSNIVQGYLNLLKKRDLDEKTEFLIEKAMEVNKEETEMIEKIKKLREIEEAKKESVDVIRQITEGLMEEKKKYEDDFEFEMVTDLTSCKIEGGTFLEELFENLIDSSLRHSHGDLVKISVEEKEEEVLCTVEDDGEGLSDDLKERIFDRGYTKGETAKSGLGIYLIKEIVESYGVRIDVKDSDLGGARFDIYLNRA
ncbi:MAG: response regulator [Thermoplasmata archaeon]